MRGWHLILHHHVLFGRTVSLNPAVQPFHRLGIRSRNGSLAISSCRRSLRGVRTLVGVWVREELGYAAFCPFCPFRPFRLCPGQIGGYALLREPQLDPNRAIVWKLRRQDRDFAVHLIREWFAGERIVRDRYRSPVQRVDRFATVLCSRHANRFNRLNDRDSLSRSSDCGEERLDVW